MDKETIAKDYAWANGYVAVDKNTLERNSGTETQVGSVKVIPIDDKIRSAVLFGLEQAEKSLGWHSVKESLPPIGEEVIVLTDSVNGKTVKGANHICFGHRPDPKGWSGRDVATGKVTHYGAKTYDGWNIPGVHHWMPCPKIPET